MAKKAGKLTSKLKTPFSAVYVESSLTVFFVSSKIVTEEIVVSKFKMIGIL